jgi:hypothetical protein
MFTTWGQRRKGLRDALPLSLRIDSLAQVVGGKPVFTLIGAPPGADVYWSSYKDGAATGEFNSSYGQKVESNGTAQLTGGEWAAGDVGRWTKEVLIQGPDGSNNRAMVEFKVSAVPVTVPAGSAAPPMAAAGNFLSEPLFAIGSFQVTGLIALLGIGGFLLLSGKKR